MAQPITDHLMSFFVLLNGKRFNQFMLIDIRESKTIKDLRQLTKKRMTENPIYAEYHHIPVERLTFWRAVLPHPPYYPGQTALANELLHLEKISVKYQLGLDEKIEDSFTREKYSPRGGVMLVVFEIDA
ncbi:hypothetical protein BGW39_002421 [Mortierella sp. 14UC]|nr:hypothetical protein BGW39_002421 [Mortierella sp. 14UC]